MNSACPTQNNSQILKIENRPMQITQIIVFYCKRNTGIHLDNNFTIFMAFTNHFLDLSADILFTFLFIATLSMAPKISLTGHLLKVVITK